MTEMATPGLVSGTVINTSRGTVVFLAICAGLLGFVAGFVFWDSWSHEEGEYVLSFHLSSQSLFTFFTVGLCAVGGVGCFIGLLCRSVFTKQLILGENVLQIIRTSFLGSTVETQIPYTNIAAVTCEKEANGFGQLQVGIDLRSVHAPGTYSSRGDFAKAEKDDRDLYLPGFLVIGPEEIARLLLELCKQNGDSPGD